MIISAPFNLPTVTIRLPNPLFGDTRDPGLAINKITGTHGKIYTYVKRKNKEKLTLTLRLTRDKALELEAFLDRYVENELRVTMYNGDVWRLILLNDPFEFTLNRDATIQLIFEGVRIHAETINC